jgi:peptidoglycan-associated lipoprotein
MGPQGLMGAAGPMGPQGAIGASGAAGKDFAFQAVPDVTFDFNRSDIRAEDAERLAVLAEYLKANPALKVEIEGFADPRGSGAYNVALSRRRAEAVKAWLAAKGVEESRFLTGAYGKMTLVCTDETEACWQKDRRVEIKLVPTEGGFFSASPAMPATK